MRDKRIFFAIPAIALVLGMTACPDGEFGSVPVTGISLNKDTISIALGGTETLSYEIRPSDATNRDVTWSSSNTEVATVSAKGVVTGIKSGFATITVTVTTKNGNKSASCIVAVDYTVATGVDLNNKKISLIVGESETLNYNIEPSNATNRNVTWSSSDPAVARVSGGVVTGVSEGEATITVRPVDNSTISATCTVTVSKATISGVKLNKENTSVIVGGKEQLFYSIEPSNATNQKVTWSSSDPAVATVSTDGVVTGINVGTATITVKTEEGKYQDTCEVTVSSQPISVISVSLSTMEKPNPLPLYVSKTETLTPIFTPSKPTNQNVTWKSSNTAIAVVSSGGEVTGLKEGTATITVTTVDGNKTATRDVTVEHTPITDVTLNKTETSIVEDGEETLFFSIKPNNATNKEVSWTIRDGNWTYTEGEWIGNTYKEGTWTRDGDWTYNKDVEWINKDGKTSPSPVTYEVAKVSAEGVVTGKKVGTATVIVTTVISKKIATCKVTVDSLNVPVTGVSLNKSTTSLVVDGTETLTATVTPTNATNKKVNWSSDDETVATVSDTGEVTGVSIGTANITVKTEDGEKTKTCTVTVSNVTVSVTGVFLGKTEIGTTDNPFYAGMTETLTAKIEPGNATNQNLIWNSNNVTVATVSDTGEVTGVSAGTATITVTALGSTNGVNKTCTVTVSFITVTFDSNKGSFVPSQTTIKYNDNATEPTAPNRNGYTFCGWYRELELKNEYDFKTSVTGDITLYAKWKPLIEMVLISGGTFTMGSDLKQDNSAKPPHLVTLSDFYMGKYEVTQEQYEAVMGANPSIFLSEDNENGTPGKLPVENVNWYDAIVFCNKLSVAEELTPAYSISGSTDPTIWENVPRLLSDDNINIWKAVKIVTGSTGYRLPTEAQWEYACRAGTTTVYNTGDTADAAGWYSDNSEGKTHEVGKKTGQWGLYDMHGNVWEWCWDWYANYPDPAPAEQTDPVGPTNGSNRMRRGGGWDSNESNLRPAFRSTLSYRRPYEAFNNTGFRVVLPK